MVKGLPCLLHVVVLDKDAGSWFIANSSLRGYDGARNVYDEERSVATETDPPPASESLVFALGIRHVKER